MEVELSIEAQTVISSIEHNESMQDDQRYPFAYGLLRSYVEMKLGEEGKEVLKHFSRFLRESEEAER